MTTDFFVCLFLTDILNILLLALFTCWYIKDKFYTFIFDSSDDLKALSE